MTSCAILDGAAIVAMLQSEATKTFSDFASKVFIPYSRTFIKYHVLTWCGIGMLQTLLKPQLESSGEKEYEDL